MAEYHGKDSTVSWNGHTIGELTDIGGFGIQNDKTEATAYTDTLKKYLLGVGDVSEISFSANFDPADTDGQIAFISDVASKTAGTLLITLSATTGTTFSVSALPISYKITPPKDGVIAFNFTIQPNGTPSFSVAAVTGMSAIGFSNDVLIMPSFAIGKYGAATPYVVTITAGQTSTVVTPVDATSGEVITITTDGAGSQVVATGEASSACTLDVDDVTQIVVTITKTGYAPKAYYFNCAVLAA